MYKKQQLTKEQAQQKIKAYCAYQERSHYEVREKLYSYGLFKIDVEHLISYLIEEDYLNEERFAKLFAGGHFRTKQWGRIKIRAALQQKGISKYCIAKGLKEIDEADYIKTLKLLTTKKVALLKNESPMTKKVKLQNYLLQKGFESNLIQMVINNLDNA